MTPIVYISGPISGYADGNRPAFERATAAVRAMGLQAVNPFEVFTEPPPATPDEAAAYWARAMRADLKALMDCTHITLLPGWQHSRGAVIEARLAADLGIQRFSLPAEASAA